MPDPRRHSAPVFQPRFTLTILYLFGFFLLYCLILVAPTLWEVARTLPPGPEQQAAAESAAREAIRGRLLFAFLAALASISLGAYFRRLPGLRPPV
jgi:ABC-type sulfate transport system permease component